MHKDKALLFFELNLRKICIDTFLEKKDSKGIKLFYKFDSRILNHKIYLKEEYEELKSSLDAFSDILCLQIKQKIDILDMNDYSKLSKQYLEKGYKIAIDNYGYGCFNYRMLYENSPDFLKIDRFFTQNLGKDKVKKIFLSSMANSAKVIGIDIIAKGVDDKETYYVCKELGINLIQGKIVEEPTSIKKDINIKYEHIEELHVNDKRKEGDKFSIEEQMEYIEPVFTNEEMIYVLEKLKNNKEKSFLPILDSSEMPLGIVKDEDLKDYVYSSYGTALLNNKSYIKSVTHFLSKAAIADINVPIEKILEIYTQSDEGSGIIITKDTKYIGFLTSKSLLELLNNKNLSIARDQNPLTKLPGNNTINQFIAKCLDEREEGDEEIHFAYLDFDNFKPFNDKYGFRNGDRAILIFADILRSLEQKGYFAAHIGGDDFFIGNRNRDNFIEFYNMVKMAIDKFKNDAESLYSQEDRNRGVVSMKSREGEVKEYKLLTVSAAILDVTKSSEISITTHMDDIFSLLKKSAKNSSSKIAYATLL